MEPKEFFEEFVIPNYDDFKNHQDSLRVGFNAATAAFHMADHYYYYNKKHNPAKVKQFQTKKKFLIHLCLRNTYFMDIQSIANAYKHLYGDTSKSWVTVGSAGHIMVRRGDLEIEQLGEVIYKNIKKNKEIKLFDALTKIIEMWKSLF